MHSRMIQSSPHRVAAAADVHTIIISSGYDQQLNCQLKLENLIWNPDSDHEKSNTRSIKS